MNSPHSARTSRRRSPARTAVAGIALALAGFQVSRLAGTGFATASPLSFEPTLQVSRSADGPLELRYWLEPGHSYELRATDVLGGTPVVLTNHTVKFVGVETLYLDALSGDRRFYQLVITGDVD